MSALIRSTSFAIHSLHVCFYCIMFNMQVWKSILEHSTSDEIGVAVAPLFQSMAWLWLLVAPCSSPIEVNLLVPPSPGATVCKLM